MVTVVSLLYVLPFFFAFATWWLWALFAAGVVVGRYIFWFDQHILYPLYAGKQQLPGLSEENVEQSSMKVVPVTLTPIFSAAYVPLALFVVTSGGSGLGAGLVLGMGLVMCRDLLQTRQDPVAFSTRFYQGKKQLSLQEIQWITWFFVGLVAILSILAFI